MFAEPGSVRCDVETIQHGRKMGVWHNWLSAVDHCLSQDVDAILTVQDDVIVHPESRTYAEAALWPHPRCGFISLYTPHHYATAGGRRRRPGINEVRERSLWGAQAMIFHPRVLDAMRRHPLARSWIGRRSTMGADEMAAKQADPSLVKNSDTAIGYLCRKMRRKMCYVTPSAAQHVAKYSSIGNRPATGKRSATWLADFAEPLFDQVPIRATCEIEP